MLSKPRETLNGRGERDGADNAPPSRNPPPAERLKAPPRGDTREDCDLCTRGKKREKKGKNGS